MIIVFGSGTIDLLASLPRLPVPGETVLGERYEIRPGGKGANQAVAAVRAGGLVSFYGAIGDDAFGIDLRRSLEEEGIEPDGIAVVDAPTAVAMVMVGPDGKNQIAVAAGANLALTADLIPDSVLTQESLVMLQMEVRAEENWSLVRRTKEFGGRVLLNLAPAFPLPPEILTLIDVLVVNEIEGNALAGDLDLRHASPGQLVRRLQERTGGSVVVTLGEKGSVAATPDGILEVDALAAEVVDTTGAGDAFVGALAAALDNGLSWTDALLRASVCGGLACRGFGARSAMPNFDEIDAGVQRLPPVRILSNI